MAPEVKTSETHIIRRCESFHIEKDVYAYKSVVQDNGVLTTSQGLAQLSPEQLEYFHISGQIDRKDDCGIFPTLLSPEGVDLLCRKGLGRVRPGEWEGKTCKKPFDHLREHGMEGWTMVMICGHNNRA